MKSFFTIIIFLLFSTQIVNAQVSSEKLIRQGVSLHDKGRYKDAIACYEEALKINPTSMSAVYEMSLSYLQLKDYTNALKYSTKVINANFQPLLVDAYTVKGTALADMDKTDDAIKLFSEALVRCGDEYLLHFNLGLCYFNTKNNQMAVQHLRKAIEIDATHSSAFLLYAYALSDADRWIQSFYSFHFFLLLEPNTQRSKDAFAEMYDIIATKLPANAPQLTPEDGINRQKLYESLVRIQPQGNDAISQYKYFEEASKTIFFALSQMQNDTQSGLLWDFFVPTYEEILGSGYFDTYCRYVSVAYFNESLEWWNNNKTQVDSFIEWFEHGQGGIVDEEAEFGDDSDLDDGAL
ncbi:MULTISPECIES: tetratricopeptide repeat protein [unclassified Dysgonomonas]|uniref:tetratricopeptide repeat protein n=1 Tax=unclassified Dysgonomonas TaxID=2630389 RepID=UPI0013EE1850|nr:MULTISPECIES: tetratricopeptide repeat protein [unclassified Dysgonomonas]